MRLLLGRDAAKLHPVPFLGKSGADEMRFLWGALLLAILVSVSASAQAKAVVILVPGAGGAVLEDFLIRNGPQFSAAGIRTLVATSASSAVSIARREHEQGSDVALVGMSRGTLRVAEALSQGAPVSRVVFDQATLLV
jgi:hypothetical protein